MVPGGPVTFVSRGSVTGLITVVAQISLCAEMVISVLEAPATLK